jgi:hypothetical protein
MAMPKTCFSMTADEMLLCVTYVSVPRTDGKRGNPSGAVGKTEGKEYVIRGFSPAALLFPDMVFGRAPRAAAGLVLILLVVQPRVAAAYALVPLAPGRLAGLGLSTAGTRGPRRAAALFGPGVASRTPPSCRCSCLPVPRGASASEGNGLRAARCMMQPRGPRGGPGCSPRVNSEALVHHGPSLFTLLA